MRVRHLIVVKIDQGAVMVACTGCRSERDVRCLEAGRGLVTPGDVVREAIELGRECGSWDER